MTCSELAFRDYWRTPIRTHLMAKRFEGLNNHAESSLHWRVRRNNAIMLEDAESQLRRAYEMQHHIFLVLPPWDLVA